MFHSVRRWFNDSLGDGMARSAQTDKRGANQIANNVEGKISIRNGSKPMPDWNSDGIVDGFVGIPCGHQTESRRLEKAGRTWNG
jgi:hypothetical protein